MMYSKDRLVTTLLASLFWMGSVHAQNNGGETEESNQARVNPILVEADQLATDPDISPARRIDRQRPPPLESGEGKSSIRSIDGSGNNLEQTTMGSTLIHLQRWVEADYSDGLDSLAGDLRPSARAVSNGVSAQTESILNRRGTSDYLWQWGQFLDHDIDLTDGTEPAELEPIEVPAGDPFFDPDNTGEQTISFNRSLYDKDTGAGTEVARMQVNEITAWIDASNVYGSEEERAHALRTNDGTGRLKVSDGDMLPFNVDGLANAGGNSDALFLAGDVRANEQTGLTAMHTLFVREHNRLADKIAGSNPDMDGEAIYQRARQLVGAQMQHITYNEFLPALLGDRALRPYMGYRSQVNASIANVFSTAVYRFGHSALSPQLLRLDADGEESEFGHLPLRNAFFSPQRLLEEGGIEPVLRGLAAQPHQRIDAMIIDDVRNFLFGPPGAGGFDLAALNIQRGRDHGLASYNDVREAMGLERKADFNEVSRDPQIVARLRNTYDSVDDVDVWVGGLSEDRVPGALVGELMLTVMKRQFEALRDGDRFWYQRSLSDVDRRWIESLSLADIIRMNTEIGEEIQDNVFFLEEPETPQEPPRPPRRTPDM